MNHLYPSGMVPGALISGALLVFSELANAATFTVTQTGDSGAGSLRSAIASANISAGADRIEFANGVVGTVSLAETLPTIHGELVIAGPGADQLTVSGGNNSRVFQIADGASVEIENLTIADGQADLSGAGISNLGALILRGCVLTGNAAPNGLGGAIDNLGGSLEIFDSRIVANSANIGAGIANDADLTVVRTTIADNASILGGGIDNAGDATLIDSTVSGNVADSGGGIGNTGQLTVFNSTLSGNSATDFGGGIENFGGMVNVEFSTLADNAAAMGGGLWNDNLIAVKNSLVVDNEITDCLDDGGTVTASGVNFDSDDTCNGFSTATSTSLALGPLAENGGFTQTHLPAPSSISIDAALDCTRLDGVTAVLSDQRGFGRPAGSGCDVGSVEAALGDVVFADGFE